MRLWHVSLLPYLPDAQFKGQLRELIAIMNDWRNKGKTNHLLINKVMEYRKIDFFEYAFFYGREYEKRFGKPINFKYIQEFSHFVPDNEKKLDYEWLPYYGWHEKEYLRVCMANLYEKHFFGVGKSKITDEEWNRLLEGYKNITGEDYVI